MYKNITREIKKDEDIRNRDKVLNNMIYLNLIEEGEAFSLATLNNLEFKEATTEILKTSSDHWALKSLEILERL